MKITSYAPPAIAPVGGHQRAQAPYRSGTAQISAACARLFQRLALLTLIVAGLAGAQIAPAGTLPASIRVVMDDNYPPFVFRDKSGNAQGILVDTWTMWSARTGIEVKLEPMDWAKAQQVLQAGGADVIDTIFMTEPRKEIYEFSAPYARLDVPIFFHQSVSGIVNADSLKGFTVGVKEGDACIDVLRERGVDSLKQYASYTAVIAAAGAGDVRVFCVDQPPAVYLLHQQGLTGEFRRSMPLYAGEFHRAVRKGNGSLMKIVEDGFARISAADRKAIEQKWYGHAVEGPEMPPYARYLVYAMLAAMLAALALAAWNFTLRRRVAVRTGELSATVKALTAAKSSAEQTLAQLDATLEAIPDLIFEIGLDGKYHDYHSASSELLAAPAEEFLGKTIQQILPHDAADIAMSAIQEAHEKGTSRGRIYQLPLAQGVRWFELSVARKPVEPPAKPRFIFVARDITDRKNAEASREMLEAQLRESQKMQAIGTLAGGIAHDFNNILATILGNVDLAREDMRGHPHALQSIDEIHKAAARARDLVQQILSFGRRQPVARRPISLCGVVRESVRLLRATLPARLTLDVRCDPDVPPVLADATQMQQVVINLVTNAMQAMSGGSGCIRIRLDMVPPTAQTAVMQPALRELRQKHPGRLVQLAVSDDGHGMDADTRARIFDPFFTTKDVGEGTGLGLSVVHGIVQKHEGAIEVDSHPDQGATFTIYLPAADEDDESASANDEREGESVAIGAADHRHIVYLDDDESLVFLVTRLLERRGYRVSGFTDQRTALEALREAPEACDLFVTDYNMPGMSGLDVAREVRVIRSDLPVAVASGFIDEALRAQAEGAGVCELIFKATAVESLSDAFARLAQSVAEPALHL